MGRDRRNMTHPHFPLLFVVVSLINIEELSGRKSDLVANSREYRATTSTLRAPGVAKATVHTGKMGVAVLSLATQLYPLLGVLFAVLHIRRKKRFLKTNSCPKRQ